MFQMFHLLAAVSGHCYADMIELSYHATCLLHATVIHTAFLNTFFLNPEAVRHSFTV